MKEPFKKDIFFNRFAATKERSSGFRFFVMFIVLLITVFMIAGFTFHIIK